MSFTFNSGIPASGNNPSSDQPIMLQNNVASEGIIAVDHIGYNASGGGQHKQVTFNSNNTPSTFPVSPPVLFTKTVGSLPQLHFYSGTAAQSSTQYSNAATFGTFLLGGLIIKGGIITVPALTTTLTFTYSALTPALAAFPNDTLAVFLSNQDRMAIPPPVTGKNATTFTITSDPTSAASFYFLAIGY